MGVQLNIKDAETVELARDLARQLGKTVTDTVREALEEKRRRREEEREEYIRTAKKIADEASKHWLPHTAGMTSKEIMDSLYDKRGLPV